MSTTQTENEKNGWSNTAADNVNEVAARVDDIPHNLMIKCESCGAMLVTKDWLRDLRVCPRCNHHSKLGARERIDLLTDAGTFEEWNGHLAPLDPLKFPGYADKKTVAQVKTHLKDSCITGAAEMDGRPIAIGATEFRFMGGSMGSVFGEKITRLLEQGLEEKRPVIIATSTGGARMQEGLMSLMQMAKTSAAVARLNDAKIPFISVLTDPSTAGVLASFASLGDILVAEPGALIGFTGARVIEQNLRIKLPVGFQSAEFQMEHGQIDLIVPRADLKSTLSQFLNLLLD
jgi:acetyl-CoA carboxylase carboxyl transferase subunit beta